MPRSTAPQHIKDKHTVKKPKKLRKKAASNPPTPLRIHVLHGLELFGLAVGLWVGIAWFLPEISVNPDPPLSADPLSTPFIIQNTGHFSIANVNASCRINSIHDSLGTKMTNVTTFNYMKQIPTMIPTEKDSIKCVKGVTVASPLTGKAVTDFVDVTLFVTYEPSFIWWTKTVPFRFRTIKQSDGLPRWEPFANSDPN